MLAHMRGTVRDGRIVPDEDVRVPEGTIVEISFLLPGVPIDMQEEFAAWDRASDHAWA